MTVEQVSYGVVVALLGVVGWQYREMKKKEQEAVSELKKTLKELSGAFSTLTDSIRVVLGEIDQRLHDQEFRCMHKVGCRFEEEVKNGTIIVQDRRKRQRDYRGADRRRVEAGDFRVALERESSGEELPSSR